MIKSRTAQLIYLSIYIGIAIIALLASFGLFNMSFRWDFYIHFTNLSNYFCMIVMGVELYHTALKRTDSYIDTLPMMKFMALLSILLTFIIYNFILAGNRDIEDSFTVGSITLHIILPVMFTIDYLLFYEHGRVRWYYPILSTIFPVAYVVFIFIHAFILKFDVNILCFDKTAPFIYPYFFLRLDLLGVRGVIKNIIFIALLYILFGYVVEAIDMGLCCIIKNYKKRYD